MDSRAIPVFHAGPFPVLHSSAVDRATREVALDVALLIAGQPNILASASFPLDDTWDRIRSALASGDAQLGVAGVRHEEEDIDGGLTLFPSAYIGLQCGNGERLVLQHIRGLNSDQDAESYAREVIHSILNGQAPEDLGVVVDD